MFSSLPSAVLQRGTHFFAGSRKNFEFLAGISCYFEYIDIKNRETVFSVSL